MTVPAVHAWATNGHLVNGQRHGHGRPSSLLVFERSR